MLLEKAVNLLLPGGPVLFCVTSDECGRDSVPNQKGTGRSSYVREVGPLYLVHQKAWGRSSLRVA